MSMALWWNNGPERDLDRAYWQAKRDFEKYGGYPRPINQSNKNISPKRFAKRRKKRK